MNREHPTKIKVDQHHIKQHYCRELAFNEEKTPTQKQNSIHITLTSTIVDDFLLTNKKHPRKIIKIDQHHLKR
jgi:hypothetical protein